MPPPDPRLALDLLDRGQWREAAAAYRALLAARPTEAGWWFNLGVAQRMSGQYEAALSAYDNALKLAIADPEEVHLNRAVIYADHLRRDGEAEAELNRALAKNPRYAPALLNLGNLREDQGDREGARAVYERVLAIEPGNADALARWAMLAPASDDAPIARLEDMLSRRRDPADAATLGFALGKALDERGAHDRAFAAYAAANAASRASGRVFYDGAQHEKLIDEIIAAFPAPEARADSADAPIFICGMFRSGSTLLEQIFASHPMVAAGGELPFIPGYVQAALAPYPRAAAQAPRERLAQIAAQYRASVAKLFPGARHVTDKRPDNYLHIGLIKRLFPNARILHTVRNPLDNCLSVYFLHLDHAMAYALDLADIGRHFVQYRRLMAHWKALYPNDILDVRYDDLVRDPRPSIERALAFCGLPWDEACLSFHERAGAVKTASVWQVRQPLYSRSSGRWRDYAAHLEQLQEALGALADEA